MIRALLALLVIAGLVAATVFFASDPGRVEIMWRNWQIDTSVGVLIAAAALAVVVLALAVRIITFVFRGPGALARRRRERRRRAGYEALTRGMVAVAAGDPQEARRYARRAEALLAEPPLTLLLSAQAAQIGGDELAATKFFEAMLERPETEFLGRRGLFNHALRDGDRAAARRHALRAVELRPKAGWAAASLFELEARDRRWDAALSALENATAGRAIDRERARLHRGVILDELSRAAAAEGDARTALKLAGEARTLALDLAPPTAHYARLLLAEGKRARAAKAVESAWRTAPHPELAQVYGEMALGETELARLARFERLAAQSPNARESHLALAEAALAAQLWGEARRYLEQALAADPPVLAALPAGASAAAPAVPLAAARADTSEGATLRLCLMLARVAEAEGDPAGMRAWLDRAVHALPDPCYICANCGGETAEWDALCPHCGAFDTLGWRTPVWAGAAAVRPLAIRSGAESDLIGPGRPALPAIDATVED